MIGSSDPPYTLLSRLRFEYRALAKNTRSTTINKPQLTILVIHPLIYRGASSACHNCGEEMHPTQYKTKKIAPTTDFLVFPRTLDAIRPTAIPSGGAVHAANHVLTTIPQLFDAGSVRRSRLPTRGTEQRKMPPKQRALGHFVGMSAPIQTRAKATAPPGRPTSIVWNLLNPNPSMTIDENLTIAVGIVIKSAMSA